MALRFTKLSQTTLSAEVTSAADSSNIMFSPITIYQTPTWPAEKKIKHISGAQCIKNKVLYDLG
jgi:hypothetical protein